MPRVLIADDNPLSLRFLCDALIQLGTTVDGVDDGGAAVAAALTARYDLLLLDWRMPKLDGPQALHQLRLAGVITPAIATSAEITPRQRTALLQAGFVGVLEKPLSLATLADAVRAHLPATAAVPLTKGVADSSPEAASGLLLDDDAALPGVGGDASILQALRQLLIGELAALPAELDRWQHGADRAGLNERLHRLQASAGFCGAGMLTAACTALRRRLQREASWHGDVLAPLRHAGELTLVALRERDTR